MKSTNNIENAYKDKFDSNSVQNEGWNKPRDIVWDKIEKDLFEKKRKKFGLLPFFLLAFLAMTMTLSFYLYNQNLELKNVIQEASTTNIDDANSYTSQASSLLLTPKEAEVNLANATNNIQKDETKNSILASQSSFPDYNSADVAKKSIFTKKNEKANVSLIRERKDENNIGIKIVEESDIFKAEYTDVNDRELVESSIVKSKKLEDLSSLALINARLDFERGIDIPKIILLNKEEKVRRPYISFLPNIAVGMLQTKGLQETSLSELIDKEYGNTGVGFDFLYTAPAHKSIDFSIGLGIESINFSTEYDITLPYMTEDETINGNEGFIDFEHSLPTAFGNTETALRLNRKRASEVLNEPNVDLDFITNHNFISLSLPIGLKYKLGSEKSFFNFGLITRPTFILNANSSIQSVFSHHSGIDAINNKSISTYANVRKLNISLGFEIGYNLFLTEKNGLNINVSHHDYLFDFYQVNDFSSSVRKVGVSIGYIRGF